jgi:hypothetical protein
MSLIARKSVWGNVGWFKLVRAQVRVCSNLFLNLFVQKLNFVPRLSPADVRRTVHAQKINSFIYILPENADIVRLGPHCSMFHIPYVLHCVPGAKGTTGSHLL